MIRIGMSTSCVFPLPLEEAFRVARVTGFDGIEIMVTSNKPTQDAAKLSELARAYAIPILSIHAPVLLATQFVWGTSPRRKLEKSAELARDVGATNVVVHPPFRWQKASAREFEDVVAATAKTYRVEIAVENMFSWTINGRNIRAYSPSPYPTDLGVKSMTLDFSHAALAGRDSLDFAFAMGKHLRHIHLADGVGGTLFDEHLVPGRGNEPVYEVLSYLASTGWNGSIVAEVNTHGVRSLDERMAMLSETVEFARGALAGAAPLQKAPKRKKLKR
jgi:sugar phosphate isomerase/epimerase